VTSHAATPRAKIKSEYPKPCLNSAITNATGVAKLMGVKAVPTVRGKRNMPTTVRTPKIARAPPSPELKSDSPEVSTVHAAPIYENRRPSPAINPIMASTSLTLVSDVLTVAIELQEEQGSTRLIQRSFLSPLSPSLGT
jgi:hypothetical protein